MIKAKRFIKYRDGRLENNHAKSIAVYNRTMGGFDRMDQNFGAYMINKWWSPLVYFCVNQDVKQCVSSIPFITIITRTQSS